MAVVTIKRSGPVRHMKVIKRTGINAAVGSIPIGTKIRFIHKPARRY